MFYEFHVPEEYQPLANDILKITTVFVVLHLLWFVNGVDTSAFSVDLVQLYIFMILAMSTYWLLIRKLIQLN